MKKTLISLTILISFYTFIEAQTINISTAIRGRDCSDGGGRCIHSIKASSGIDERTQNLSATFFKDANNHIVEKIPKLLINNDLAEELKNKTAYFLEKEESLDESIQKALNAKEPLILTRGWHPLIELEDCYIISYTLKQ